MCRFDKEITDSRIVTGYKLAVKDKYNHYYSPVTGIRYEVGKVKAATKLGVHNIIESMGFDNILNQEHPAFDIKYIGKTAIFKELYSVKKFKKDQLDCAFFKYKAVGNFVILEMKLSGELYHGRYGLSGVYIGSEIKSIKKIKE